VKDLPRVIAAARDGGALVAVDVLHPGRPRDFERLAPLLAMTHWFLPNAAKPRSWRCWCSASSASA
jgi:hypothetical protein